MVYDRDIWWSDQWDSMQYGLEYNFKKPFFSQFQELLGQSPLPAVFNGRSIRSFFCNRVSALKDAYLVFDSFEGENVAYSSELIYCKDTVDSLQIWNSELVYESVTSEKLYRVFFSQNLENCNDSFFLYNCHGCASCFGCTNLRNKSYYMFNEPYSKEEYQRKIKEFDLGSFKNLQALKQRFQELKLRSIRKSAYTFNSSDVTGDYLWNVHNCKSCFRLTDDVRDSKFLVHGGLKISDSYDNYGAGINAELLYESVDSGVDGFGYICDIIVYSGNDVSYSYNCYGCQNLFGCVGLRNKQYCILNKQYSKEEYVKLVPQIIHHMNKMPYKDKKGRMYKYGEFFPPELSPFAYNETITQEYFPLTKEQALKEGYLWKDHEMGDYTITILSKDLPDHIKDVTGDILNQIIGCAHGGICNENPAPKPPRCRASCSTAFRIIPHELEFYRLLNLPLPRLCPNCRHYQRIKQRTPLKLWRRKCYCAGLTSSPQAGTRFVYQNTAKHFHGSDYCPNTFETAFAPEGPEIVYCEACYNNEVA
ncbi:MAG: hypothetical protein A3C80_02680 [Candidatus Ryanbacteria bacterium RIFCSPHIGHO2_02_FULL_45_43]|uniref:Uncharacterized protein n=1 Tax=Candidatus Ryanbacteria bacterium RIFCSPHIGHO2_01_45_13 TaxID=1802112 RepID=A0A1G2FZJ8_9BACT|nr:MAG: hypothetical protein A2W41_04170 [Candidatus Ryanbacteria bacterium RIFCSPHIGHO2_01_45_13]OGZ47847.1 MAG: hypothetical protein A3C80_02680 [Candidatus Ryanbacteria bacterium RIFCSPHIGHO2_02_FULL_45_43]OGZ49892.1 MAG: hypothetical protein A3E55_03715 [Candidatus Ryanbacteria bacterium RIFCSPHIGHO2_12_FULL_44_20]OGZ51002.1 MAG: hypothetical protein A3A17_03255 [Candidatus Ryanbacteria bacterium RIFCSPLOWO2_01_FULL_44_230]OGZ54210.1 MAG: hypothetical protein A3H62_01275 [Candidatus Ryanbac